MISTLKEIALYLEDLEKNETNTPIRLRSVLKNVDNDNILAYVKSFIMNTCNTLYKSNNIFCERICTDFINSDFWKYNCLLQNELVSYPELMAVTKKYLSIYVNDKLQNNPHDLPGGLNQSANHHRTYYKAIVNKRNKQEDRYFCVTDVLRYSSSHFCQNSNTCVKNQKLNLENISLLGLFDGHNGPEAAEHCHHLAPYLLSQHLQSSLCITGHYNLIEALGETFHLLNFKLNGCRNKYRWKAGTTSTMCLVDQNMIYTSWVGDSSAWLIYKDKRQVHLTSILHRPSQNSEIIDVWNNGGIVTKSGKDFDRVNGVLAVTRALGDDRKIVGVSPLPSISECKIDGTELCLVLASDGLWDSKQCSGLEIGDLCREFFSGDNNKQISPADSLCQTIIDRGVKGGASDNISLVLLVFNPNTDCKNINNNSLKSYDFSYQDSRAIKWPRDRRMSCFSQDLDKLRLCPEKLSDYLQIHFSHDAKMHSVVGEAQIMNQSKARISRSKSITQEIHKRFSSPIRAIKLHDTSSDTDNDLRNSH